jgi:hypothetical protein
MLPSQNPGKSKYPQFINLSLAQKNIKKHKNYSEYSISDSYTNG